jgi:hypothetical protein
MPLSSKDKGPSDADWKATLEKMKTLKPSGVDYGQMTADALNKVFKPADDKKKP